MSAKVTIKDIIAMILIILSFTTTGIMIKNENYKQALLGLAVSAFCVLITFVIIIIEDGDKILDLSNPNLRNPRKSSNSAGRVTYVNRLTPDMAGGKSKNGKKNKGSSNDLYMMNDGDDFYESVGNMRVYQRGDDIEIHDDEN